MNLKIDQFLNSQDEHSEKKGSKNRVREGEPMGGHNFGKDSHPPTGDDKANPSRNAGYTNAYLAKTEPSEEYTEDYNFRAPQQQGEPDYDAAQRYNR